MKTPADGDDMTWADGNGPQPEYATTEPHTPQPAYTTEIAYAYGNINRENITATPCARRVHIYDVTTFPERLDADIAALREELATLRAVVTDLAARERQS